MESYKTGNLDTWYIVMNELLNEIDNAVILMCWPENHLTIKNLYIHLSVLILN